MYYKAFISYSHEADKTVAAALQSSLHKIAKPWYRLPLIRVCRDETSLAANPTLWRTIESELARSDYLILVASPGSAKSEGVSLEIEWWLENHGTHNLLFVLTGGELKWDRAAQKFTLSTAISGKLATRLSAEPLFADLRRVAATEQLDLREPRYRSEILKIAAKLYDKRPEELDSEDRRERKRARRTATTAVAALVVLAITTTFSAILAVRKSQEAERQRDEAVARRLAAEAAVVLEHPAEDPELGVLLAVESVRRHMDEVTVKSLRQSIRAVPPLLSALPGDIGTASSLAFDAQGRFVAVSFSNLGRLPKNGLGLPGTRLRGGGSAHYIFDKMNPDNPKKIEAVNGATAIHINTDGLRLRTAQAGKLQTWETSTGKLASEIDLDVLELPFGFSKDGRYLGSVRTHDELQTGREVIIRRVKDGARISRLKHPRDIEYAAFLGRGPDVLTKADDGLVRLWSGRAATVEDEMAVTGRAIAFGPVENLKHHKAIREDLLANRPDPDVLNELAELFLPERLYVLFAETGGGLKIRNLLDRKLNVFLPLRDVISAAFSPNGSVVATIHEAQSGLYRLTLWDLPSGKMRTRFRAMEPAEILFSPTGRDLLAVGMDARIVPVGGTPTSVVLRPTNAWLDPTLDQVKALTFSPNGTKLAIVHRDDMIRIWEPGRHPRQLHEMDGRFSLGSAEEIQFSPNGDRFILRNDDTIALWNTANQKELKRVELKDALDRILMVKFTPDGSRILRVSQRAGIAVLEPETLEVIQHSPADEEIWAATLSPDGKLIATGNEKRLRILTTSDGERLYSMDVADDPITAMAFSPDSKSLGVATYKGMVRLHRIDSLNIVWERRHHKQYSYHLEFLAGGQTMATAGKDGTAGIWSTKNGSVISRFQHNSAVRQLTISADERYLGFGTDDGTVSIVDLNGLRETSSLRLDGPITSLEFSPGGDMLAAAGPDESVHLVRFDPKDLIDIGCEHVTRNMTCEDWERFLAGETYQPICPALEVPDCEGQETKHSGKTR